MFDIKWIRENPDAFDAGMAKRGLPPMSGDLTALDAKRRDASCAHHSRTSRSSSGRD